jgi:hypothetical protein
MAKKFLILMLCALLAERAIGDDDAAKREVSVADIASSRVKVIGELGIPMMTVCRIEGVIFAGRERGHFKAVTSDYYLRVISVNEKPLAAPAVMEFSVKSSRVVLPSTTSELYKLVYKREMNNEFNDAGLDMLEKEYVGRKFSLLAYETGYFNGMPHGMPKNYPLWQDHGAGFSSSLIILDKVGQK